MTEPKGWLKLHRTIMTSSVFSNPKLLKFWIWILCKAFTVPAKVTVGLQEVDVEKGQFVFGRFAAANELQMTNSTVYKYLKILEKERMVVVKSNNKFSLVSVVNWCDYQDKKEQEEQQSNNKRTTKEQQSNTNKELKNIKNKDNIPQNRINEYTENEKLRNTLNEFLAMRKKIKSEMTDYALKLMLEKLDNLSGGSDILKMKILNKSIESSWKGIFELKDVNDEKHKAEQISKPLSMQEIQKAALQMARQKEGRR